MKKRHKLPIVLVLAILALLFLWVRENGMRVAAESKLSNLQYKATTVINEKGDTITDLSTQLGEFEARLQQTTEETEAKIVELNEQARLAAAGHEAALEEKNKSLAELEADLKRTSEKYDASLKKKNTELSEMGEELRKTTERLAASLKEKEQAESESYDLRQNASSLGRKIAKLAADNRRLEALAKVCEGLADGPKNTV